MTLHCWTCLVSFGDETPAVTVGHGFAACRSHVTDERGYAPVGRATVPPHIDKDIDNISDNDS